MSSSTDQGSRPNPTGHPGSATDGFAALADPTRRAILAMLAGGDRTVNEIAASFPISRPGVSKHLRILRCAGLVLEERRGRERVQHFDATALRAVSDWVNRYEPFWRRRLAALKTFVEEDP